MLMLRRSAMVVVMLLVSLVMACAPQAGGATPTTAPTTGAPKAAAPPTAAATPKPVVEKPQRGGTLTFAFGAEAAELDPQRTTAGTTRRYARLLYNTLVNTDQTGDIVPELAESWSYPDPNTLVLKLRRGVKFHDGTDFNAQAVKFNLERVQDPATKNIRRIRMLNITSVEVVDDYTVKLSLKTPQAIMLANLAETQTAAMISPASVKKWGEATLTHPVGTGPFELVEWVKDDHLTVKRFDGYWRKDADGNQLPYLDQVIIKPIPDSSVMLTNLRTGAVDVMDSVVATQLSTVKADSNLKTVDWGSVGFHIVLNCLQPPFNNKALRQAVSWAIDRESIHKALFSGRGAPGRYRLPSESWAFDPTGKFYSLDLAKAKEKLAEGGKPNGFKFVARSFNTDFELRVAQAMKGQLAEVGIEMEIVPMVAAQLTAERLTKKYEGIFGTGPGLGPDPDDAVYGDFHSTSAFGTCGYASLDEQIEKARQVYDRAERKALYAKIQATVLDDAPEIWLHGDIMTTAMNQKVMGFTPNIDIFYLQLDWMWLKK